MNLTEYLSGGISRLFTEALSSPLTDTRERFFLVKAAAKQKIAAQKRLSAQRGGKNIPPFLIASIASKCNLHCAGCYARANGACADKAAEELDAGRWAQIFSQARSLGVSFILLAGGEPLERPDVLDAAAKENGLIFPVFTNGTLLSGDRLERFDRHRNLIPVLSIEGNRCATDERRGKGTFDLVEKAMGDLGGRGIFYGVSITVTKKNLAEVSEPDFAENLWKKGCRLMFFVEYVPAGGDTALAPEENERLILSQRQEQLRRNLPDMIFLSFPGDEKKLGGCLAAGRGFFHINPAGGAEPCPFSPYSDTSLKTGDLDKALDSPLFRKIRENGINSGSHSGGCVLFEKKNEVEALLK